MKKVTEQQFEGALAIFLSASQELSIAQAQKAKETTEILKKFEAEEKAWGKQKEEAQAIIEAYVNANRSALFADGKKSLTQQGVKFGFRLGKPALKAEDWDEAFEKVKKMLSEYIIIKESLDKTALVKDADKLGNKLTKAGLSVEQQDIFFIEI